MHVPSKLQVFRRNVTRLSSEGGTSR
jgi:hypothetical protein